MIFRGLGFEYILLYCFWYTTKHMLDYQILEGCNIPSSIYESMAPFGTALSFLPNLYALARVDGFPYISMDMGSTSTGSPWSYILKQNTSATSRSHCNKYVLYY